MAIRSAKDLVVYQKAYALAMRAFEISKGFPAEERFALTRPAFARDCADIRSEEHEALAGDCDEIGRMLGAMIRNPGKLLVPG